MQSDKNWYAAEEYIRLRDIIREEIRAGMTPPLSRTKALQWAEYRMDNSGPVA